jgi:hypothetical protein
VACFADENLETLLVEVADWYRELKRHLAKDPKVFDVSISNDDVSGWCASVYYEDR